MLLTTVIGTCCRGLTIRRRRNCRFDIPAGKSLGRVADTSFSHVHFLYPSEHPALSQHPHCAWRWYNGTTPTSCVISGNYPVRRNPPQKKPW